jgi:hypothetical protein
MIESKVASAKKLLAHGSTAAWTQPTSRRAGSKSGILQQALGALLISVGEAVGVGAGFDDRAVEGETVHDGGAEPRVGEGFGPAGEGLVGAIAMTARRGSTIGSCLKDQLDIRSRFAEMGRPASNSAASCGNTAILAPARPCCPCRIPDHELRAKHPHSNHPRRIS